MRAMSSAPRRSSKLRASPRSSLAVGVIALLGLVDARIASADVASADEGLGSFGDIGREPPPAAGTGVFGPVPTEKPSIANLAPVSCVRSQKSPVTGDWGGARTALTRNGYFFDVYSTSTYQDVKSGGLKTGHAFVQNTQLSFNLDTGRAGLWPGGLLHFTVQSRYGDPPDKTFTVGSYVPQYTGLVEPGALLANNTLPSEYFLVQSFSKTLSAIVGKISDVYIPDQTLFGNSYKYYFANFNLNKNPMTTNFYNPTAWALLGVWTPTENLALGGGVLDPNSKSNNFATHAFDKVNLYFTAVASYNVAGLPGQFSPSYNWSNKPKLDLSSPFQSLSPAQVPAALGTLLAGAPSDGLQANYKSTSEFLIANFSQYLYLKEDPAGVANKLKSGLPLNGIGVFGRVGFAPEGTNPVTRDASLAIFAHGLFNSRRYDSFGAGFYYNKISGDLKHSVGRLTGGTATIGNEKGTEVFYDFAITPAFRFIASYQYVRDPLIAQVAAKQNSASLFLTRVTVAF